MQDAAEIVDAVKSTISGHSSLQDAVTGYEDRMRPRGKRDVELSLQTASKLLVSELKDSPMFKMGLRKLEAEKVSIASSGVELAD